MVTIGLPEAKEEDFWKKVPAQRHRVNQLMRQGVIINYALSDDLNTLWIQMNARDNQELKNYIGTFPMIKYMSVRFKTLRFAEHSVLKSPYLFLN